MSCLLFSTGNITATLTDTCWGTVKVCIDGDCGGVCADTWTHEQSEMLCKDLGCGQAFTGIKQPGGKPALPVKVLAMHSTRQTTTLTESIIVRKDRDTNCDDKPAFVVCSGKRYFEILQIPSLESRLILSILHIKKCHYNTTIV